MSEITVARRVSFSSAHLYEQSKWSADENRRVFGACYTAMGHGHNYTLEAFYTGPIDARDLMVLNVNDLDAAMKEAIAPLDHQHINFVVDEFKRPSKLVPTTENLALWIGQRLEKKLSALNRGRLTRIRLFESSDLYFDTSWPPIQSAPSRESSANEEAVPRIHITEEVVIRSMHHLINRSLSVSENEVLYGKCFRLHGHHYRVQATLAAPYNDKTGFAVSRPELRALLQREVVDTYHGRNLNHFFSNTSCEAVAVELCVSLAPKIRAAFQHARIVKIAIQETPKNYFEYRPSESPD